MTDDLRALAKAALKERFVEIAGVFVSVPDDEIWDGCVDTVFKAVGIDALRERVGVLTEALEPFADFASRFGETAREDSWVLTRNPSGKGDLTMGDVRAARSGLALARATAGKE